MPNALGVDRSSAEFVLVAPPSFASTTLALPFAPVRLFYDVERKTIYATSDIDNQVVRFRYDGSSWVDETFDAFRAGQVLLTLDGSTLILSRQNAIEYLNPDILEVVDSRLVNTG